MSEIEPNRQVLQASVIENDMGGYTYSFNPPLTDEIIARENLASIVSKLVPLGGGFARSMAMGMRPEGGQTSQDSGTVQLTIPKSTPRKTVEQVFSELNGTGSVNIHLQNELYPSIPETK